MEFDEIFFEWNFWSGALDKVDLLDDCFENTLGFMEYFQLTFPGRSK
jgi:hypothetical protein